jgi:hypothetical protein
VSEANESHDPADSADDQRSGNRQFVVGGIIVALTLAIAAWLAYGVVERSSTSPRAAGLVPDGSNGASLTTPARPGQVGDTTSSTSKGAGTSTTIAVGTHHGSIPPTTTPETFANGSSNGISAKQFAVLWPAYNGKLYDPEDVGSYYTVDDCTRTLDTLFLTADITTVAKAKTAGATDAASFTSQLTLSSELCWVNPANDALENCWMGT